MWGQSRRRCGCGEDSTGDGGRTARTVSPSGGTSRPLRECRNPVGGIGADLLVLSGHVVLPQGEAPAFYLRRHGGYVQIAGAVEQRPRRLWHGSRRYSSLSARRGGSEGDGLQQQQTRPRPVLYSPRGRGDRRNAEGGGGFSLAERRFYGTRTAALDEPGPGDLSADGGLWDTGNGQRRTDGGGFGAGDPRWFGRCGECRDSGRDRRQPDPGAGAAVHLQSGTGSHLRHEDGDRRHRGAGECAFRSHRRADGAVLSAAVRLVGVDRVDVCG